MNSQLVTGIVNFLREIGLAVHERPVLEISVLPGISVDHGALVLDRAKLKYPGDLLHEAGHLAVVPPYEREQCHENVGADGGMEMGAIAWSYAAALHLGIDPSVVFHDDGYRGGADSLRENFATGHYVGVPILVWRGLTTAPARSELEAPGYPHMTRWLTA